MASFYLGTVTSDLSGGADFNNYLEQVVGSAGSLTPSIAKSATETSYGFSRANIPSNAAWQTGAITVKVNVTTANSSVYLKVNVSRVNSAGTVQESATATAEQLLSTTGVKTFSIASKTWAAGNAGDRIRVEYSFRNSATSAKSVTIETNTANTEVSIPINVSCNVTSVKATATAMAKTPYFGSSFINDSTLKLHLDARGYSGNTATWDDLSSYNHDGALNGFAYTAQSGWDYDGLVFDGVGDYVDCGITSGYGFSNTALTVESLVKINSSNTADEIIVANVDGGGFGMALQTGTNKLLFQVYVGGAYRTALANAAITLGRKYHIIGRYDGAEVSIWIDGVKQTTVAAITGSVTDPGTYICLGMNPPTTTDNPLFGKLSMVRIYDRGLTDTEIAINYAASTKANIIGVKSTATATAKNPSVSVTTTAGGPTIPSAATATAMAKNPSIGAGCNITGVKATATAIFKVPSIGAGCNITGVKATATAAGKDPSISTTCNITGVKATATATARNPALGNGINITSVRATATADFKLPSVSTTQNINIQSVKATATATAKDPSVTITSGTSIQAVKAAATAVGKTPSISNGVNILASQVIMSDSFNRSDSATLGNADTGQTWIVGSGNLGILDNKAYVSGLQWNNNYAYIDLGDPDVDASIDITHKGDPNDSVSLNLRTDGTLDNRVSVSVRQSDIRIRKGVAGVLSTLGTYTTTFGSNTRNLRLVLKGINIKVYLDGNTTPILDVNDDNVLKTLTKHGFHITSSTGVPTATIDNFKVLDCSVITTATATTKEPSVSVGTNATIQGVKATATAAAKVPNISTGCVITSVKATAIATAKNPSVGAGCIVTSVKTTATTNAKTPSISTTQNVNIQSVKMAATSDVKIPSISSGSIVTSTKATATSIFRIPSISTGCNISGVKSTATAIAKNPSISSGCVITSVKSTATAIFRTPGVGSGCNIVGTKATAITAAKNPGVSSGCNIVGVKAIATVIGKIPNINGDSNVICIKAIATATANARTPSIGTAITVDVQSVKATATAIFRTPSVSTVQDVNIQGVIATATSIFRTPSVSTGSNILSVKSSASATGKTPNIVTSSNIASVKASATAIFKNPSIGISADVVINAQKATGDSVAHSPSISSGSNIRPVKSTAIAIFNIPTVTYVQNVDIQSIKAEATGIAKIPNVSVNMTIQAVTSTGNARAMSSELFTEVNIQSIAATAIIMAFAAAIKVKPSSAKNYCVELILSERLAHVETQEQFASVGIVERVAYIDGEERVVDIKSKERTAKVVMEEWP